MSLQCPACKESIDDDSLHCDQCGTELRRCTECGRLGVKSRCSVDGKPMVPLKSASGAALATAAIATAASTVAISPAVVAPVPAVTVSPVGGTTRIAPGNVTLRLFNHQHGITVRPASGALIGRGAGPHVDVFSRFPQISTRHLELRRDASGVWWAKDVNSFNHSFYNGVQLTPHQEQALSSGGVLTLADIALNVAFE